MKLIPFACLLIVIGIAAALVNAGHWVPGVVLGMLALGIPYEALEKRGDD